MNSIQSHFAQGQKLPEGWRSSAPIRAQQASSDYMEKLQNAWRKPLLRTNDSEIMRARLRPTADSRVDSLRLVVDDQQEEVWQETGVTVRIKKKS